MAVLLLLLHLPCFAALGNVSAGRQWVASHGKQGIASLSILGEAVHLQIDQMITCLLSVSGLASPYQGFDLAFDVPKKSHFRSIDLSS